MICGYIHARVCDKNLDRLHHPNLKRPQYVPHRWIMPAYVKIL